MTEKKTLPADLTSYDLLKTFAVLTMIIDHIGAYLYPDILWLRLIGRLSFPVWLFLVGYSNSRDIPSRLLAWGGALVAVNLIVGNTLLPLNILFSIALTRVLLDRLTGFTFSSAQMIWFVPLAGFFLSFFTLPFWHYGTLVFLFALSGYMVRHKDALCQAGFINERTLQNLSYFIVILYALSQAILTGFSGQQTAILIGLLLTLSIALMRFSVKTYPEWTAKLPAIAVSGLKLCGRRTMEVYVIHVAVLMFAAMWLGTREFHLFQWSVF